MDFSHPSLQQSQRLKTVHALFEAYNLCDPEKILETLDDALGTHQVLPYSLGMPVKTTDEFRPHATRVCSAFEEMKMDPYAIYEDPVQNAVIVHTKMTGKMAADKGGAPWSNECVMMMKFNEDGTKIIEHREFVDSAKAKVMQELNKRKDGGAS